MIVQIIISYLESNKRLIIPQLGAFIVKSPEGPVVFSELLRHDDGVLRGLLCAAGMGELEAAGAIDRFVFEVRYALEAGEKYVLLGLGILKNGPNGTIGFAYQPKACVEKKNSALQQHSRREPKISPSVKLNPDPSVKGLRYGKPDKVTSGAYRSRGAHHRGVDKLMLVAIVAVVIALATIAYVYIRDARYAEEEVELPPMEQTVDIPIEQTSTPQS